MKKILKKNLRVRLRTSILGIFFFYLFVWYKLLYNLSQRAKPTAGAFLEPAFLDLAKIFGAFAL